MRNGARKVSAFRLFRLAVQLHLAHHAIRLAQAAACFFGRNSYLCRNFKTSANSRSIHARAWLIVMMALGSLLMIVDSNTKARNADYREQLQKCL